MSNITVSAAQIKTLPGDLIGNFERIKKAINSVDKDVDVLVFPECAISGYNCGHLFKTTEFLNNERALRHEIVKMDVGDLIIVLGCLNNVVVGVDGNGNDISKLYNSAVVIKNNKVIATHNKIHLAESSHHYDGHWFDAGNSITQFEHKGAIFGVMICEDAWNTERDLFKEYNLNGAEAIISLNNSYATATKLVERIDVFAGREALLPTVYCNNIGVGDFSKNVFAYDGQSFFINRLTNDVNGSTGKDVLFIADAYKELNLTAVFDDETKRFKPYKENDEFKFDIDVMRNENLHNQIIFMIKELVGLTGLKAQVHMSGGIDSAVVGVLAAKALGPENVVMISNPSKNNGAETKGNAQYIADMLNIELKWEPIEEYVATYKLANPNASPKQIATAEATFRSVLGLSATHENKTVILSCGNHTENALGFFNFHDIGSIGLFQPIGDLTKVEVYALAKYINYHYDEELIPKELCGGNCKPSAELEDNLGEDPYDYKLMSKICSDIIRHSIYNPSVLFTRLNEFTHSDGIKKEHITMALRLIDFSAYKRAQSAPCAVTNSLISFGLSRGEPCNNVYNQNKWDAWFTEYNK